MGSSHGSRYAHFARDSTPRVGVPVVEFARRGRIETRRQASAVMPTVDSMTGFIFFSSAS
jgi:hypothetical protein